MNVPEPGGRVIPELTRELARAFQDRGEELFLIGGTVRHFLLGEPSADLDFATSALPPITAEILAGLGLGRPYRIGEQFGTIGLNAGGCQIEITTYRTGERYPYGSRKPEVSFGATLLEDLERRDFTINAIALEPLARRLVDPLHGREDLEAGVVRAVGDPDARFEEDPLRLLRAVRFAASLDFEIEPATWASILRRAPEVGHISRERIRDEYSRILTGPAPARGLTLLRDTGLMAQTVPLLFELTRMPDHGPRHPLSLWDHTMRTVEGVPAELSARWAALLHDIAKPRTRTHEPSGRPRFFHHEEVGEQMAREILSGLRYPNQLVEDVALLVSVHMQLHAYSPEWSNGAVRRLSLRLGPLLQSALALVRADGAAHSLTETSANSPKFDHLEARLRRLEEDGISAPRSPLSGEDLMARFGKPPGPWIRAVKSALEHEVLEGTLGQDDREQAWAIATRVVEDETG